MCMLKLLFQILQITPFWLLGETADLLGHC